MKAAALPVLSSGPSPSERSDEEKARKDTICVRGGRIPATPCPAIIAWVYSVRPKLAAKAKAPFCISPAPQAARPTMSRRNVRYAGADASRKDVVDMVSRLNTAAIRSSAVLMRKG